MGYLALSGGDALAPFHAQDVWGRHFAGPYVGVWDGVKAAFDGARSCCPFSVIMSTSRLPGAVRS